MKITRIKSQVRKPTRSIIAVILNGILEDWNFFDFSPFLMMRDSHWLELKNKVRLMSLKKLTVIPFYRATPSQGLLFTFFTRMSSSVVILCVLLLE